MNGYDYWIFRQSPHAFRRLTREVNGAGHFSVALVEADKIGTREGETLAVEAKVYEGADSKSPFYNDVVRPMHYPRTTYRRLHGASWQAKDEGEAEWRPARY